MYRMARSYLILSLLTVAAFAGNTVFAQEKDPAYSVIAAGIVRANKLGIQQDSLFQADFMLDPGLSPTKSISTTTLLRFIDPWRWHWIVITPWDWLRGFIIEIPRPPFPIPEPWPFVIRVEFDDPGDMVMNMPGIRPLERGTQFITSLMFKGDSAFLRAGRIPVMDEANAAFVMEGSDFEIQDPAGKTLLQGTIDKLEASPSKPACEGDTDGDGDVDASDLGSFRLDFGRRDCPTM